MRRNVENIQFSQPAYLNYDSLPLFESSHLGAYKDANHQSTDSQRKTESNKEE